MFSCLRGSDSLPPGQSLPSECGAPLQMLLDQPRIVQMNVARLLELLKFILIIIFIIIAIFDNILISVLYLQFCCSILPSLH